jgi:hypothetical protein
MMEEDQRSDEQADEDWRRANTRMFGTPGPLAEQAASSADWHRVNDRIFGAASPPTELAASRSPSPLPGARMSFFDEEYVEGRRVPSPTEGEATPEPRPMNTSASSAVSHEPPAHIANARDRIYHNLFHRDIMPDFPAARIPPPMFNPSVHLAMVELVAQRNKTEADLSDMVLDKAADGTLLDPNRDYEPAYQRLSSHINDFNRALYVIYAQ